MRSVDSVAMFFIPRISSPHPLGLVMAVAREVGAGLEVHRVFGDIG